MSEQKFVPDVIEVLDEQSMRPIRATTNSMAKDSIASASVAAFKQVGIVSLHTTGDVQWLGDRPKHGAKLYTKDTDPCQSWPDLLDPHITEPEPAATQTELPSFSGGQIGATNTAPSLPSASAAAPASELPLSAEQINGARMFFPRDGFPNDLCDQALAAIALEKRVTDLRVELERELAGWLNEYERAEKAVAELAKLKRGEFVCIDCGLRKDSDRHGGDF